MKSIILVSGGLDSTTLLYDLLLSEKKTDIMSVFYNYGQKSLAHEQKTAKKISKEVGVPFMEVALPHMFCHSNSTLLSHNNKPVTMVEKRGPVTTYLSEKCEVEFRNGIMIATAISLAIQLFPQEKVIVYYGAIKTREGYADCSEEFIALFNSLAEHCSNGLVEVSAPFVSIGKDEVLRLAKERQVPIEETWSCYDGGIKPCGMCPACLDRKILEVDVDYTKRKI